jgi:hypothetical protein
MLGYYLIRYHLLDVSRYKATKQDFGVDKVRVRIKLGDFI